MLVTASASGSQLGSYAFGAANVILVVGTQKLVRDLATARDRIDRHSLPLEDAPKGYKMFKEQQNEVTKVVLKPH